MKTTKLILATSLILATASLTFAGPGPQYWQDRLARRALAATTPTDAAKAAATCCRVITVQRPISSHKVFIPVKTVECPGCAAMAAGEKCPMS